MVSTDKIVPEKEIVELHNIFRRLVGRGKNKFPVADMKKMVSYAFIIIFDISCMAEIEDDNVYN